jgi:hypothetical protein
VAGATTEHARSIEIRAACSCATAPQPVPDLIRSRDIKLNERVLLCDRGDTIAFRYRTIAPCPDPPWRSRRSSYSGRRLRSRSEPDIVARRCRKAGLHQNSNKSLRPCRARSRRAASVPRGELQRPHSTIVVSGARSGYATLMVMLPQASQTNLNFGLSSMVGRVSEPSSRQRYDP